MGNTSSLPEGRTGKDQRELVPLDTIIKEVDEVSSTFLVITQGMQQNQQQGTETSNEAAKELLEELLRNAFEKLKCYFKSHDEYPSLPTTDAKGTDLLDAVCTMRKEGQKDLMNSIAVFKDGIRKQQEAQTVVEGKKSITKSLRGQVVAGENQPDSRDPMTALSKHNSKSYQETMSEEKKDQVERETVTVRAEPDIRAVSEASSKRQFKDKFGNNVEIADLVNSKKGADSGSDRDESTNLSFSDDTQVNQTFINKSFKGTMQGPSLDHQDTNSTGNNSVKHITGEPKVAGESSIHGTETDEDENKGQCQTGDIPTSTLTTNTEDWTHIDAGECDTTQTIPATTIEPTKEIERLQEEIQLLKGEVEALKKETTIHLERIQEINSHSANEIANRNTDIQTKQREILSLKDENGKLLLRLSKLAGEKLTKDNPNITDLSDLNRPTKLGEIFSELYDNEWTDAFEGLTQAGYLEVEAIRALNITLKNVYKFCAKNAADMIKTTEHVAEKLFEECNKSQISVQQSMAIPMTTNDGSGQFYRSMLEEKFIERHWKPKQSPANVNTGVPQTPNRETAVVKPAKMESELVKLRKEVSLSMVPVVQQAYLRGKWDETCIEPLKPYIKKCLFLCWMMVVQSPPMVFDKNTAEGTRFESALYKQYTKTGEVLEFMVWPALLLHEDGPIVCKGVAQPKKAKE